jgi:hypothetical protein
MGNQFSLAGEKLPTSDMEDINNKLVTSSSDGRVYRVPPSFMAVKKNTACDIKPDNSTQSKPSSGSFDTAGKCAVACDAKDGCMGFSFNSKDNVCFLSTEKNAVANEDCDTDFSYWGLVNAGYAVPKEDEEEEDEATVERLQEIFDSNVTRLNTALGVDDENPEPPTEPTAEQKAALLIEYEVTLTELTESGLASATGIKIKINEDSDEELSGKEFYDNVTAQKSKLATDDAAGSGTESYRIQPFNRSYKRGAIRGMVV